MCSKTMSQRCYTRTTKHKKFGHAPPAQKVSGICLFLSRALDHSPSYFMHWFVTRQTHGTYIVETHLMSLGRGVGTAMVFTCAVGCRNWADTQHRTAKDQGACRCTACSAHAIKPSQGGREETTLYLCRRHKVLHIPGGWWPWPSATCCCLSVLKDGGSLLGT